MVPDGSPTRKNTGGSAMIRSAMIAGGGSGRHAMKKGPWTAGEDAVLKEYVRKHGEGNWNAVQRNSGLMRCGKSCRLRWANHLRPNLKKGAFSADEENLIVQLHAKFGNKWARMASQLPGRTDNEIKNYWNTRLKRRQRAGLPIYPLEVRPNQNTVEYHPTNIPSISSASLGFLLSPPPPPPPPQIQVQKRDFLAPVSIFNMFTSPAPPPPPPPSQNKFLASSPYLSNNGLALSLSSVNSSPFSPPSSGSFAFGNHPGLSSMPYSSLNFGRIHSNNSRPFLQGLPSIQYSVFGHKTPSTITTTASSGSDCNNVIQTSSSGDDPDNQDEAMEGFSQSNNRSNTGLLEDLFGETLTRSTRLPEDNNYPKNPDEDQANANAKFLWDYKLMEDANVILDHNNDEAENSPTQSFKMTPEEDEDLVSSLLDNSQLAGPMPELCNRYGNVSNGDWLDSGGFGEAGQQDYSGPPTAADHGASSWKIPPEIY